MATQTTNYRFTKDAGAEYYDVTKVNANLDAIDAAIKEAQDTVDEVGFELDSKANKSSVVIATLTVAGWTGTVAPYSQLVAVDGVTATNNCSLSVGQGAAAAQYVAASDGQLLPSAQAVNSITIKAFGDKPTVDIPISVLILG